MLYINEKLLCSACFAPQATNSDICDTCRFDNSTPGDNQGTLPMGHILMGRYVIGRVLGRGGFGITYLAYDIPGDCRVAVKEYFPDALSYRVPGTATIASYTGEREEFYRSGAERFYKEAQTLSHFAGNANIIEVREFFYENNTAYYAMEYVDGVDLKKYVALRGGRLPYDEAMAVMMPVAHALATIHARGVLHRDVSPDNIYLATGGVVKLLDFGAARQVLGEQSNSLSVVLKQGFTPLEQYQKRGKHGPWSDIYAFGATLYYLLCGAIPEESINRIDKDELLMPSALGVPVPPAFEPVLAKMLALQPEQRYQSFPQLREQLQRADSLSQSGGLRRLLGRAGAFAAGHKAAVLAVAGAVLLLAVGIPVGVAVANRATTVTNEAYTMETAQFGMSGRYTGQWRRGKPNGDGAFTVNRNAEVFFEEGDVIEGTFVDGLPTGEVTVTSTSGSLYQGGFEGGLPHGDGVFTGTDGTRVVGAFRGGVLSGQATITYPDGAVFAGNCRNGVPDGQGTYTYPNGDVYEGNFSDGWFSGQGTYTFANNGDKYTGAFAYGNFNGYGVYTDAAGNVLHEGQWVDDVFQG